MNFKAISISLIFGILFWVITVMPFPFSNTAETTTKFATFSIYKVPVTSILAILLASFLLGVLRPNKPTTLDRFIFYFTCYLEIYKPSIIIPTGILGFQLAKHLFLLRKV